MLKESTIEQTMERYFDNSVTFIISANTFHFYTRPKRGADPPKRSLIQRFGASIVMYIEQAENLSEIGIAKALCYLFFLHFSLGHRESQSLEKIVILGKIDPIDC